MHAWEVTAVDRLEAAAREAIRTHLTILTVLHEETDRTETGDPDPDHEDGLDEEDSRSAARLTMYCTIVVAYGGPQGQHGGRPPLLLAHADYGGPGDEPRVQVVPLRDHVLSMVLTVMRATRRGV